jgi:uncharacterized protein YrrD
MLRRLEDITGCKVEATDGQIGSVKDVLFDEGKWTIRHLVVDAGSWLSGNQVLISPFSVQSIDLDQHVVALNLTRKQIEDAPSIESDRPVSRQFETRYYNHYGWPAYWVGPYAWGYWAVPAVPNDYGHTPTPAERELEAAREERDDPELHSFKSIDGLGVDASDGGLGDIEDMIIDDESWQVRYVVVDTAKLLFGKDVLVPPDKVGGIIYNEAAVQIDMTRDQLKGQPEFTSISELNETAGSGPVQLSRSR